MRGAVLASLLPGPAAGDGLLSRRSDARRESADRNALASALTSSVDAGSASVVGRPETPAGAGAATVGGAEGAVLGSVRTMVASAVHTSSERRGRDKRVASRRSLRIRRLWGTRAAAQCSSHRRAELFGAPRAPSRISSSVPNADSPPRWRSAQSAHAVSDGCRSAAHAIMAVHSATMAKRTVSTRTGRVVRCTATASNMNTAEPHNASRAAATNCPSHNRRRTAICRVCTMESAIIRVRPRA